MSRSLKTLNQILDYELGQEQLYAQAEQRGPLLNVSVEYLRGHSVDTGRLLDSVRAAADAAMVTGIRKVNVYLWRRGQKESDPEWWGSFEYEPLQISTQPVRVPERLRQDHLLARVFFFACAVAVGGAYLTLPEADAWYGIPGGLALLLGLLYPVIKRRGDRYLPKVLRWGILILGLGILVGAGWLIWQWRLEGLVGWALLLLLGFGLVGLG